MFINVIRCWFWIYFPSISIDNSIFLKLRLKMGTRAVGVGASTSTSGVLGEAGLAGVPRLLEDLARLSEDKDTADIVFLLGRDETPVYGHRIILQARSVQFFLPRGLLLPGVLNLVGVSTLRECLDISTEDGKIISNWIQTSPLECYPHLPNLLAYLYNCTLIIVSHRTIDTGNLCHNHHTKYDGFLGALFPLVE